MSDARQRKEMGKFDWLSNKVGFCSNELKTPLPYFGRQIFAVDLSTGKGRLNLKDLIVAGGEGNNS